MFQFSIKTLITVLIGASGAAWAAANAPQTTSSTYPKIAEATNKNEMKPHIGLMGGFTSPDSGYASSGEYGINAGYQPWIPFGIGAEVTSSTLGSWTRTNLLATATYNFGGDADVLKNSYVGLGLGPIFDHDGTHVALAPLAGFDVPLGPSNRQLYSLGLYAKYMMVGDEAPDAFSMNGMVKYWF
jgi:hypothetical protein